MSDTFDTDSVMSYLRRLVAHTPEIVYSPNVTADTEVVNVERISDTCMVLDCANGYTIRLDIDVYERE